MKQYATLLGVKIDGSHRHIASGQVRQMESEYLKRNPQDVDRIVFFSTNGIVRTRNVVTAKSESTQ